MEGTQTALPAWNPSRNEVVWALLEMAKRVGRSGRSAAGPHRNIARWGRGAEWPAPCGRPSAAAAQTPSPSTSPGRQTRHTGAGTAGCCLRRGRRGGRATVQGSAVPAGQQHSTAALERPSWDLGRAILTPCQRRQDELAFQALHKRPVALQLLGRQRLKLRRGLSGWLGSGGIQRRVCRVSCGRAPPPPRMRSQSFAKPARAGAQHHCRPGT